MKRSAPDTSTMPRTSKPPSGLALAARHCFQPDLSVSYLCEKVAAADTLARQLLAEGPATAKTGDFCACAAPLISRGKDDRDLPLVRRLLEQYFAANPGECSNADYAKTEVLSGLTWPALEAGFLLGLCIGQRLRVSVNTEGGER